MYLEEENCTECPLHFQIHWVPFWPLEAFISHVHPYFSLASQAQGNAGAGKKKPLYFKLLDRFIAQLYKTSLRSSGTEIPQNSSLHQAQKK